MARLTLPPEFSLKSKSPVSFVNQNGDMVPSIPLMFPSFYGSVMEIYDYFKDRVPDIKLPSTYSSRGVPLMPTPAGLVFDTEWAPFGSFDTEVLSMDSMPSIMLLDDLKKKKIRWNVKCPVMENYESLIGLLTYCYGRSTGANPDRPGMNQHSEHVRYPLKSFLSSANPKDLIEFNDRGRTLLDLAVENQQWDLAEFVWDKGVRWSETFLSTARPLEALIVATRGLQGYKGSLPNDYLSSKSDTQERINWLETWQNRYIVSGGDVDVSPSRGWRARLAKLRSWEPGLEIQDTPASFWMTEFLGRGLPKYEDASEDIKQTTLSWVRFFSTHGIDLTTQEVDQGTARAKANGFADLWKDTRNSSGWIQLVESCATKVRLTTIASKVRPEDQTQTDTNIPKM